MMERTTLNHGGVSVSALGLGCAGIGRGTSERDAHATMAAAIDSGIEFFDTSDLYGVGASESLIGSFIAKTQPGRLVIGTKFGSMPGAADGVGAGPRSVNNHPDYIPKACDASLRRLGVDVIDIYYMHRRDPAVPIAESVGAMGRLVAAGKIRCLGLSEVSAATLREAHCTHPIAALQSEYSLWMRDPETDVLPVCAELGITFVPFSPLGRAFLTGTLAVETLDAKDFRASLPRFQGEAAAQNMQLVRELKAFADRLPATPAQVALAWLLAKGRRGPAIVPIPGTRRPAYVAENAAAAGIVLSGDEIQALDAMFAPGAIAGDRYTPEEAARAGT
jgi:aryl-alcohol dehydrogenase-like predicted oxidoreductase